MSKLINVNITDIVDESGYIEHRHKNEEHNLVVLCKKCHQKTHSGSISIEGYRDTLNGRQLIWHNTNH